MITTLNASNESLVAILAADPATSQPVFQLSTSAGQPAGSLTGDAEKSLLAGGAQPIGINSVLIHNRDTAAATVTLSKKITGDDAATLPLMKRTIPAGGTMIWSVQLGCVVLAADGAQLTAVGAAAHANIAAGEAGADVFRRTTLTLNAVPITVGNTTGISFGSRKLYDFPQGRIQVMGVILDELTVGLGDAGNLTPINGTHGGDVSIGTTATADATLNGTDVNLLPSTSIDPISSGINGAALAAAAVFDGTTSAIAAFLNMIIDDADVGDGASDVLLLSGTVTIVWIQLGDY